MLRLIRTLFAPGEPRSHHVHYHVDDHGRRRFCDESICRPAPTTLSETLITFTPYR